jgi:uncharacterized membrane protein YgdD (TMEM256/DUF423 family)
MPSTLLAILSALFGVAGIGLYAVAAHASGGSLDYAAVMLLAHAPALLAISTASKMGVLAERLGPLAGLVLALGVVLFAGDLALRTFTGDKLFPMAAPTGGLLAMAGWLAIGVAAVLAVRRRP